jgi:hypothetical protein
MDEFAVAHCQGSKTRRFFVYGVVGQMPVNFGFALPAAGSGMPTSAQPYSSSAGSGGFRGTAALACLEEREGCAFQVDHARSKAYFG